MKIIDQSEAEMESTIWNNQSGTEFVLSQKTPLVKVNKERSSFLFGQQ